jgi:hypothetical protein
MLFLKYLHHCSSEGKTRSQPSERYDGLFYDTISRISTHHDNTGCGLFYGWLATGTMTSKVPDRLTKVQ